MNSCNIDGTLSFGIKLKKSFFISITISFLIGALACFIPLILFFCSVVELTYDDQLGLIGLSVMFFVSDCISLMVFIRQYIFFKHNINKYLNDPLLFKTKARMYEFGTNSFGWFKTYRLIAEFEYEGEEIQIKGKKFCKQFKKYIGNKIDILYSPTYNEILFFKNSFSKIK